MDINNEEKNKINDISKLVQMYQETHDENIKNEIVLKTEKLVASIASDYGRKLGISVMELKSFGYEGLLIAIEKYDPNLGANFITYAYDSIKGYILAGIPTLQGTKYNEFYRNFIKYKTQIEDIKGVSLNEDITILDDILMAMIEKGIISKSFYHIYKDRVLLDLSLYIDEIDEPIVSEDNAYDLINEEITNNLIEKYLNILNSNHRFVLENRFGLYGKEVKTLKQIGDIMGLTSERVRQLEAAALKNIRKYNQKHNITQVDTIDDDKFNIGKRLG